ncbi:hypothetical protein HMPREF1261_02270 [Corynebacterium sp. KPL1818]|uniref:hypothetical protein n=1 Tax=Corynebacterium sp. KPL1818 TaxID=1203559 RepID=UPI0003B86B3B|nr:hypothetical protein [Corynebacterium sp. KPL1818]ERS57597.1 hypothetical protein HMPREF1261_02270 [Corynebacterium sp. KPL1818]
MDSCKLRTWLTSDAAGLAILGISIIVRGSSYLPMIVDQRRTPVHFLESLAEPSTWSWVWLTIGLFCLAAIPLRHARPLAVGLGIGIHFMWAVSFIVSGGRGWVTAIGYATITLLALWAFGRGRAPDKLEVPELKGAG